MSDHRGQSADFVPANYAEIPSEELIDIAQTLSTKAEVARLNVALLARLSMTDRDDDDMTLAALQAVQAQEAKLASLPERNNDMVFEGTNPEVTAYSTEKSLPQADVDKIFDEITAPYVDKKPKGHVDS